MAAHAAWLLIEEAQAKSPQMQLMLAQKARTMLISALQYLH
jgi:hypothetical protein